jgi:hypothetical protein
MPEGRATTQATESVSRENDERRTFALGLPVAVSITVAVALPFGLWLGSWTVPMFPAFVVWTEYFTLGAKPAALKIMAPAYLFGTVAGAASLVLSLLFNDWFRGAHLFTDGDVAWFVGLCVAFVPLMWVIKLLPFTQGPGGLPYFNGITMGMATYFVGGYENYAGLSLTGRLDVLVPVITMLPALLGGVLGMFLGWFNIAIMAPFHVRSRRARLS